MTIAKTKDPVFVVVQLSGGNDFMNTLVPYTNHRYYDNRKFLNIAQEDVLPLDTLSDGILKWRHLRNFMIGG